MERKVHEQIAAGAKARSGLLGELGLDRDRDDPPMLALRHRAAALSCLRHYSTEPPKPSIKLVAELRKLTEVSINKAREALVASNNDVQAALRWLEEDRVVSGAKKAEKLEGRTAKEGLVGVSILSRGLGEGTHGTRAAMVELNCETDFVARNELFGKLLADISHTAAYMAEPESHNFDELPVEFLLDAPLLSHEGTSSPSSTGTIGSAIRDLMTKVGEKVSLRRAIAHSMSPSPDPTVGFRVSSYVHGSVNLPTQGRIGTLVLEGFGGDRVRELIGTETFRDDLAKLERSLARQIAGFPTRAIHPSSNVPSEEALYSQPFMMYPGSNGETVSQVLTRWAKEHNIDGPHIGDFKKWSVGESIEEQAQDS